MEQPTTGVRPGEPDQNLGWLQLPALEIGIRPLLYTDNRHLEWHGGTDWRRFYQAQWEAHRAGRVTVLVAVLREFPVAQECIVWSGLAHLPGVPHVQSLRTMVPLQGMGIGSALLQAAETLARRRGYPRMGLSVAVDNESAERLYRRLGYQSAGASYQDQWTLINARGEPVIFSEKVHDLVKRLNDE